LTTCPDSKMLNIDKTRRFAGAIAVPPGGTTILSALASLLSFRVRSRSMQITVAVLGTIAQAIPPGTEWK